MIRLIYITIFLTFIILPVGKSFALTIESIRFGKHPDKIRMVIELDKTCDFRVFTLTSPNRLVIDLPEFEWNEKAKNFLKPANSGIKSIRKGKISSDIERLVVDLSYLSSINSAFLLPQNDNKPNRIVIDFKKSTKSEFLKNKGKIYGSLKINDTTDATEETFKKANNETTPIPRKKAITKKYMIVIDAGHGGVDPGAIGANRLLEKNVTLKIAKELKRQLLATGKYNVKLTREKDIYLKLHERRKFARNNEADLFISLHADSINKKHISGASVYTLSEKSSDAQTEKLAARENRADLIAGVDLSEEGDDVAEILIDLAMRDTMNQSKFMANTLVENMKKYGIKTLDNAHRYAGFAVLKSPDTPSILIEMGFMSNYSESRKLNSPSYRKKISASIVKGVNKYFEKIEKNRKY